MWWKPASVQSPPIWRTKIEAIGASSLGFMGKASSPCSQGSKSAAVDLKAIGDSEISWSELPPKLVLEIFRRLQSYQDFVYLASTCSSWRLIGTGDKFAGGYEFAWLMLAEEEGSNLRGFYNVRKNMTCYLELPEAMRLFAGMVGNCRHKIGDKSSTSVVSGPNQAAPCEC